MNSILHFVQDTDFLSLIAYAGLAVLALLTLSDSVAVLRFHARVGAHARTLAVGLRGEPAMLGSLRLPKIIQSVSNRLRAETAEDRLHLLELLIRRRIASRSSVVKACAPSLGIAGTMSGMMVFLPAFDEATRLGQKSIAGLNDATMTTWIGLMVAVASIVWKAMADKAIDRLVVATSESLQAS